MATTDLWLQSTSQFPLQKAWQVVAAMARTIDAQALCINLEAYYKGINGVIAYREGSNFIGSSWDREYAVDIG